jgi:RimJ/RimL family protein N-acetyltransferase
VPEPDPLSVHVELRDGTPILIRPLGPQDRERLRRGFARLSTRTRYRRFGIPLRRLSDTQLRSLTEIDRANHMAWLAIDAAQGDRGVGVARYVRLPDEPDVAEAAVVVGDDYQTKGLGSILLGMLGAAASANGIERFRAYVLTENTPMLEILRDLGGKLRLDEPGVYRVDLPIPSDPEELPDTPTGRVFKALAKGVLPPLAVLRRALLDPGSATA